ncbi:MAG: hypothetical protein ACOZDY_00450 [Pseudomonadota bacterium]
MARPSVGLRLRVGELILERWQATLLTRPVQVEGEVEWATLRLMTPYKWF